MVDVAGIKGIIFDYGGTIDSNGKHWAEVLWEAYQDNNVPVTKDHFREAFVYAERYLAANQIIMPDHNFYDLLCLKVEIQIEYLFSKSFLENNNEKRNFILGVSNQCYTFVKNLISEEMPLLVRLYEKYPIVLVSNFYGNIHSVLEDFGLSHLFNVIVESAVVGIRKPDPAIFALGIDKLGLEPEQIVVIGDSYRKDIIPAMKNGCKTIWLKGISWDEDDDNATADIVIADFNELETIFFSSTDESQS